MSRIFNFITKDKDSIGSCENIERCYSSNRVLTYNALKGFGSIGILFSHMSYLRDASNSFWKSIYVIFMSNGSICSTLFILCSGFFMSYAWKDIKFTTFIKNKLKRIYPLTFLVFVMALIVDIVISGNNIVSEGVTTGSRIWYFNILANLFLIKAYIPMREVFYSFHGPSWYISVLFGLYVIGYPFVKGIHSEKRQKWTKVTAVVCAFAYAVELVICIVTQIINMDNSLWLCYVNPWFRIFGEGLFGVLLCELLSNTTCDSKSRVIHNSDFSEIMAIVVFILAFLIRNVRLNITSAWIQTIPMAYILIVFRYGKGLVSKIFENKGFQFLGNISFELYMTHAFVYEGLPVIAGLVSNEIKDWLIYHAGTRFLITFMLSIVVAYIVHLVLESVNRKKHK